MSNYRTQNTEHRTPSFWRGKRVFLTGHSGFKGGWMTLWLESLGAKVCGYSLVPDYTPNLYTLFDLPSRCEVNQIADICDYPTLAKAIKDFSPEMVIHMAAQPLVRRSYREPLLTIATNVDGTVNVLEACREVKSVRGILVITTDKCYKNKETTRPYIEDDELGGHDIYSASKACAEIITHAYRQSFFDANVPVVTARAGNVIGGGDWSEDRLIPDAARAFAKGETLVIRSPKSVRPWQHVAEPLLGYLMLAQAMLEGKPLSHAYNFGPDETLVAQVERVVSAFAARWQPVGKWRIELPREAMHEAGLLTLDSTLARGELGWKPRLSFEDSIANTADWYRLYYSGEKPAILLEKMLTLFQ